jgi:hypothetical protein
MTKSRSPTIRAVTQGNAENGGNQLALSTACIVVVEFIGGENCAAYSINRASKPPSATYGIEDGSIGSTDSGSDCRAVRCKPHRQPRGAV